MLSSFPRPSFAILLFSLGLTGCTTIAPGDLLGSVSPSLAPQPGAGTLPPPPGLSANPSNAPLTPGRIAVPAAAAPVGAMDEVVPQAPPMSVQPLGDLPRGSDGVMILPPAPRLDVIDIEAVRDGLAGKPPRSSAAPNPPAPGSAAAPASSRAQGGLL
jgi:hypothetical protein